MQAELAVKITVCLSASAAMSRILGGAFCSTAYQDFSVILLPWCCDMPLVHCYDKSRKNPGLKKSSSAGLQWSFRRVV